MMTEVASTNVETHHVKMQNAVGSLSTEASPPKKEGGILGRTMDEGPRKKGRKERRNKGIKEQRKEPISHNIMSHEGGLTFSLSTTLSSHFHSLPGILLGFHPHGRSS